MKTKLFATLILSLVSVTTLLAINSAADLKIREKVKALYPNAIITDIDSENGKTEVEIIDKKIEKDILFSSDGSWMSTKYEIKRSKLPENIKNAIEDSPYEDYSIDEVTVIEMPTESLYEIELSKWFEEDIKLYISFDGEIL